MREMHAPWAHCAGVRPLVVIHVQSSTYHCPCDKQPSQAEHHMHSIFLKVKDCVEQRWKPDCSPQLPPRVCCPCSMDPMLRGTQCRVVLQHPQFKVQYIGLRAIMSAPTQRYSSVSVHEGCGYVLKL